VEGVFLCFIFNVTCRKKPRTDSFCDIVMELDSTFDGDAEEIEKGIFVSYKYLSESPTEGTPVDPKISFVL
jgi:hypothetical protein